MNSGLEKKLSMDELLEKNRPAQMAQATPQLPAQELTPPPEVYPSKAEWEELLSSLYTLGYHTERQTGYQFSDEDLRRRIWERVQNVKKTHGRVSLEQRVRGAWEEDDEWQD